MTSKMSYDKYFAEIDAQLADMYSLANKCKNKGFDPEMKVETPLAQNMVERVIGLISVAAPHIVGTNLVPRILELEKQYDAQDWRVALTAALEVAQEKLCKFKDKTEAMEIGIRVGIAYITNGVVSSPLEGFTGLKIRKRRDGKDYFALCFSGPIRSAGGTGASMSVVIGDYVRKHMGYETYDPDEQEINHMVTELYDYHERVNNLQYLPSEDEIRFMVGHLPVQIDGDPSEKIEVSNYKGLDRIETDRIRNGPCLVIGEGLCQKAPKLLKNLSKWGKGMGMEHWLFLDDFLKLQKQIKSKQQEAVVKSDEKIKPDYTFIKDLVAGRPVFTYPLAKGGFRLRYGRGRNSGFSCQAIHPATMFLVKKFIAIGTQLKVERPGKSSVIAVCDEVEGPIVKLKNGDVCFVEDAMEARKLVPDVEEIIHLGDILINYGDFLNRNHVLVPAGYCEEWWALELRKAVEGKDVGDFQKVLPQLFACPSLRIDAATAILLSKTFGVPLHPRYTYRWLELTKDQFVQLYRWYAKANIEEKKIVLPLGAGGFELKRIIELLGVPHRCVAQEYVVVEGEWAEALRISLTNVNLERESVLAMLNQELAFRDKSGTSIGARMGRPEKAKMRKMTGSPHILFPVGDEGGRMRCFASALEKGFVEAQFPLFICERCKLESIYGVCGQCGEKTARVFFCPKCNRTSATKCHAVAEPYRLMKLDIKQHLTSATKLLGLNGAPELIKGVRGTSNKDHVLEHLAKGVLRAKYNLYVNKDGTIRYDMTEMPLTHFKPKEVMTSLEKLHALGYTHDIYGEELADGNQILELKMQDVVLPCSDESLEESPRDVLFKTTKFIDDLLVSIYGERPFYNLKSPDDVIGHYVVGLAPHISAGIVGRVIGFSKTQGFLAHPCFHSIMRRDCFDYNTSIPLCINGIWQNVKIGGFVENLKPVVLLDSFGTLGKCVDNIYTLGFDPTTNRVEKVAVFEFTKHTQRPILEIVAEDGRVLKVTESHKLCVLKDGLLIKIRADNLKEGDMLYSPLHYLVDEIDHTFIDLEWHYRENPSMHIRGVRRFVDSIIDSVGLKMFIEKLGIARKAFYNYLIRDSFPLALLPQMLLLVNLPVKDLPLGRLIGMKRDRVSMPVKIPLNEDVLNLVGLYIAEGFSRKKTDGKGHYQVDFAASEKEIRDRIRRTVKQHFNLDPSFENEERLTYSSHIFYDFFVHILDAGKDARTKKIPSLILNLPKNKLRYFLQGYFDGGGLVSLSDLRVTCNSVNDGLISDIEFALRRYGILTKRSIYTKMPGPKVKQFYIKKGREIPLFTSIKLIVLSNSCVTFLQHIGFSLTRKQQTLRTVVSKMKPYGTRILNDSLFAYPKIKSIKHCGNDVSYCLNVDNHIVIANGIMTGQCDGDESAIMLLMDMLLNFSRKYLPDHRGATQDAPLVLTSRILPKEVDDMVFDMDVAWNYSLELYEAALQYKSPNEVKVERLKDRLGTPGEYEGYGFTHNTDDINGGVRYSAYKALPTMEEKVMGQMDIANKIRAVDCVDVAKQIIERHFIRDIRGNLRKFSTQQFRCVKCNEKYRRPPLIGRCLKCEGNIIFTVAEGSIIKYLEPSLSLAEKYNLSPYLRQSLEITKRRIESIFGKEVEKQEGLGKWFG